MADSKTLKATLWSSVALLVTLFIAWYFSRNKGPAETMAPSNGVTPALNFGGTSINVPGVTPTLPGSPTPVSNVCCKRCNDSSAQSGGKILQSGSFTQNTLNATHAAIQTLVTTPTNAGTPVGIELIPQQNGGMPLPSESWWVNDPTYRQAYVLSYNQTVGQLAQMLMQQKRPAISQMPMSYAESSNPAPAENLAQKDGATQLARGGHDTRWLNEAQSNSMLMMQTMQQTLGQWLSKLGDPHAASSSSLNMPADQNVASFLIN